MSSPPANPTEQFKHLFAILCVTAMNGHLLDQDYRDAMEIEYLHWLNRIDELLSSTLVN